MRLGAWWMVAALGLGPGVVYADPYPVGEVVLDLPAPPKASLDLGDRLYVALGDAGVWVYDVSGPGPVRVEVRGFEGAAVGLSLVGDQPWVILQTVSGRPLAGAWVEAPSGGAVVAGGGAVASEGPGPLRGEVLSWTAGTAIVDRGSAGGLAVGDRVRILVREPVVAEGMGDTSGLYRERESGVGEVSVAGPDRAQVVLDRGGRARPGDLFEVTREVPAGRIVAPQRLGELTELAFDVRPFLAVGTLGVGSINEVSGTYLGKREWFAEARLQPLSLGWSRDGNLLGVSTTAVGGYDNRFFAIGLGAGFTAANTGVTSVEIRQEDVTYAPGESGGYSAQFEDVRRGFSIGQLVRLGSRDGLSLEVRNTFVLAPVEVYDVTYTCEPYDDVPEEIEDPCYEGYGEFVEESSTLVDAYREVRWGSTQGRLTVPVVDLTDLVFDVGGGATGFFSATGGVQTWLKGNGDVGSLGMRVAAGYGVLAGELEDENILLRGPLLSLGMRWRW